MRSMEQAIRDAIRAESYRAAPRPPTMSAVALMAMIMHPASAADPAALVTAIRHEAALGGWTVEDDAAGVPGGAR
jgi:hypothetical protein